ncbi:[4Fe-4S] proteins maturation [Tilletia horrida]|uniref:[4Fe-4S] proteins maturation n=1 Tax=Tilletia horrida TaxID=155126 RepID=A0AAN6GLR4_9BASI|nr:[4Fe-4S] proteins maturation [Tilletia horrida]KAK0547227.1 [4Fe-4S] proteins maturation [Tilletia horrida]KAK0561655.1 [4Fe-4S] proteins maturation [Tilletia horrida]
MFVTASSRAACASALRSSTADAITLANPAFVRSAATSSVFGPGPSSRTASLTPRRTNAAQSCPVHERAPSRRHFHASARNHFDAQSLAANSEDEGTRIGAILTASQQPKEPADEGVWRGGGEPTISLTRRAVERLQIIASKEQEQNGSAGSSTLALRLAVEPGGCHGYQYKIELTEEPEDDDFHFQATTRRSTSASDKRPEPLPILIDSTSLALLKGSTIDYVTELIGSQFAIRENPQAKGSGCGCGISWEPAI